MSRISLRYRSFITQKMILNLHVCPDTLIPKLKDRKLITAVTRVISMVNDKFSGETGNILSNTLGSQ